MSYPTNLKPEDLQAKIEEISRVLKERGVSGNCPRCGHTNWQAEFLGYFVSALPVTAVTIPPPHIPVVNLTCTNCGSTQMHHLTVLGINL